MAHDAPATFVLVHGAWAGSWIWRDVIKALRAAGHDVYATTATGMGDRVHLASPNSDLDVYITDVVNLLEFEDLHDVHLVGWSFGGMIITGVAERAPERLAQLIYVDAIVSGDGENSYAFEFDLEAVMAADITASLEAGTPGLVPITAPVEEWLRSMAPDKATQDWMFAHFTPRPLATGTQPLQVNNPTAAALPHIYLYATEGKGDAQTDAWVRLGEQIRANPDWTVVDVADTHLFPVNDPRMTVETLLSLL